MKVENIISKSGNAIANQFVLSGGDELVFQSYDSTIITIDNGTKTVIIGRDYDYSVTTGKYRNIFFEDYAPYELNGLKDLKVLRKAIEEKEFNGWKVMTDF